MKRRVLRGFRGVQFRCLKILLVLSGWTRLGSNEQTDVDHKRKSSETRSVWGTTGILRDPNKERMPKTWTPRETDLTTGGSKTDCDRESSETSLQKNYSGLGNDMNFTVERVKRVMRTRKNKTESKKDDLLYHNEVIPQITTSNIIFVRFKVLNKPTVLSPTN